MKHKFYIFGIKSYHNVLYFRHLKDLKKLYIKN
jgi:hypothetical protein